MFGILLLELHELYDQVSASLSHFPLLLVIMLACFVSLQSGPKKEWRLVTLKTDVSRRYGLIGNLFLLNLGKQLVC